jgi:hypothetical protein
VPILCLQCPQLLLHLEHRRVKVEGVVVGVGVRVLTPGGVIVRVLVGVNGVGVAHEAAQRH